MTSIRAEVIGTRRLVLLPLGVEHAQEMAVVLSDPALHTFIGGEPASAPALRSRYERLVAGSPDPAVSWCNWMIQLPDESPPGGHGPGDDQPFRPGPRRRDRLGGRNTLAGAGHRERGRHGPRHLA
jgi:hypothetical protein